MLWLKKVRRSCEVSHSEAVYQMKNAGKTSLVDLMNACTPAETAKYAALHGKLLKKVEAAVAKKRKEAVVAQCKALHESVLEAVNLLKIRIQQYLTLERELQPPPGNDLTAIVQLSTLIKTELAAAGVFHGSRVRLGAGSRGPRGQYKHYVRVLFTDHAELGSDDFFEQMAQKTGKPVSLLKRRYALQFNRQLDGIKFSGNSVFPAFRRTKMLSPKWHIGGIESF